MKTCELFKTKKVLSFEIFPPKRTDSINTVYDTVKQLAGLNPDFISVTYGAGGAGNNAQTFKIASDIKNIYNIESVAHLPCINLNKEEVLKMLGNFKEAGIDNILALRGDISPDYEPKKDFKYARDLISFIRENGDFNIAAACYPEGHIECDSIKKDIENLKIKVEAGVNQLITQLFFDNNYFYSFLDKASAAGIHVPIQAGIMPVVNKNQIKRMVTLCGATLPKKLLIIMDRYENDPEGMREAGITYAIDQIVNLLAEGAEGIHLYTMNNPYIAHKIHEAVNGVFAQ